jgi:hypothetical protein
LLHCDNALAMKEREAKSGTRMRIQETAPKEFARHRSTIEALARDAQVEAAYVTELYEHKLGELQAHAKVRDFLQVLAARAVRSQLRRQQRHAA